MSRSSIAEQFVSVLRQAGVERVYGVVGDSLNPFVDAVRRTDGIAWVLVEPGDVLDRGAVHPTGEGVLFVEPATGVPGPEQLSALAERLNAARTVTLFCGAGTRGAHGEVMELAGRVQSPVGHSLRGNEWIQHGDVGATLRAVLPLVEQKTDRSFLDAMLREHARALERVVDASARDVEHQVPIHPEYAASVSQHPRPSMAR